MGCFPPARSAQPLLCLDKDEKFNLGKNKVFIVIICFSPRFQRRQEQKASSGAGCQELGVDTDVLI